MSNWSKRVEAKLAIVFIDFCQAQFQQAINSNGTELALFPNSSSHPPRKVVIQLETNNTCFLTLVRLVRSIQLIPKKWKRTKMEDEQNGRQ